MGYENIEEYLKRIAEALERANPKEKEKGAEDILDTDNMVKEQIKRKALEKLENEPRQKDRGNADDNGKPGKTD